MYIKFSGIILIILSFIVIGCGVKERKLSRPDGTIARIYQYYDSENIFDSEVLDGWDRSYDSAGRLVRSGMWVNGKPWDGELFIRNAGDAGSFGIGSISVYKSGKLVSSRRLINLDIE